jgi:ABC-type multidrug transport system permease subunit
VPQRLSDVTIQPLVFTLLFLYVFGSAIHIKGMSYQNYLLPGLLGQSLAFGVIGAGVATATDFNTGVIDRFRSLPVTRLSVISSQVIGQILEQILGIVIVAGMGLALGWRPHMSPFGFGEFLLLMLLGLSAFTWFGVLLGMIVKSSDAMQGIGFAIVFPLSFLAGTFVPIAGMKLVPRTIGDWDPLSALVASVRHVTQGTNTSGSWQLTHPVVSMIFWCVLIIAVCVPLALRRFMNAN